jgi:hypothetical protein
LLAVVAHHQAVEEVGCGEAGDGEDDIGRGEAVVVEVV